MKSRKIVLGCGVFSLPTGFHPSSWRQPKVTRGAATNIKHYVTLAQIAERGFFDLFFVADTPAAKTAKLEILTKNPTYMNMLEPLTLLSALAVTTSHIGLGATVSTSFYEPFNLARQIASIDHISNGRVAWNVVTSASDDAARNFGLDRLPPHDERYQRAEEFFKVVTSLWDSWEDDAFIEDPGTGRLFDPTKFHPTRHKGKHFSVHGALNIGRMPQGRPVIIQAGSSAAGKEFAARTADIVFASDATLVEAQAFYGDLKARLETYGRTPEDLCVLAGFSTVVAGSQSEAEDKYMTMQQFLAPEIGVARIEEDLEADLGGLDLDQPIPESRIPRQANFHKGYFDQITTLIREEKLSLRQLYMKYERGKKTVIGNGKQIADAMEEWFTSQAADGFMLPFYAMPSDLEDFILYVVPELQRRGLYKAEYEGSTLRTHLGLQRPTHFRS